MKKETTNTCKNCTHWKAQQAELEYHKSIGFCTNDKFKYNSRDGLIVSVFDRESAKKRNAIETISSVIPFGNVDKKRFLLCTDECFGCIFHKK